MAGLATLAAGCASTAIAHAEFRPGTDFSRYKTFALAAGRSGADPRTEGSIRRAIAAELAARGLSQVESGGDLEVHPHARLRPEQEGDAWEENGWGYRRGWWGSTRVDARDLPVGTLVVDLVDPARGELVWRGVAGSTVDPKASPEWAEQRASAAMAKLFKGFPAAS